MTNNPVRGLAGESCDKTNAAGIEIESRVDQAAIDIGRQGREWTLAS
jgi:hypothetical protein